MNVRELINALEEHPAGWPVLVAHHERDGRGTFTEVAEVNTNGRTVSLDTDALRDACAREALTGSIGVQRDLDNERKIAERILAEKNDGIAVTQARILAALIVGKER